MLPLTALRPASRRPGRRRCRSRPCRASRSCASAVFSRCRTIRAPEAPTGWPSAMAPPSTLSFSSSMAPSAPSSPSCFPAVLLVLPRREAAEHLRGEGLVDLPVVDVVQREAVALEDRRGRVHRPEAHLRRDRGPPIGSRGCGRSASGRVRCTSLLGSEDQPGRAVGDLRAVAGRDVAVLAVEEGLELGEVLAARSRAARRRRAM